MKISGTTRSPKEEGYRVNRYPALDDVTAKRVATEWRRFFDEWGYSTSIERPGDTSAA
jgi:hypothetical protein